jgi:hypothetical protein
MWGKEFVRPPHNDLQLTVNMSGSNELAWTASIPTGRSVLPRRFPSC